MYVCIMYVVGWATVYIQCGEWNGTFACTRTVGLVGDKIQAMFEMEYSIGMCIGLALVWFALVL